MQNTLVRKLKRAPEGYLAVGIDPHRKRHAAVAVTQDFTNQAKRQNPTRTVESFKSITLTSHQLLSLQFYSHASPIPQA